MNILEFEKSIGYSFKNKELLKRALTHSSFINAQHDRALMNNERLEFLGDAFFDAIISEELCKRMPKVEEGVLTKIRAKVICEKSLAMHGNKLGIGQYIRLGKGEREHGGKERPSIIADALEAIVGAIFTDGGYDAAKTFVIATFDKTIDQAIAGKLFNDYKTEIQEKITSKIGHLEYKIVKEEGPPHDKVFYAELYCNEKLIGQGIGKTKKEAENNAAKQGLERGGELVL